MAPLSQPHIDVRGQFQFGQARTLCTQSAVSLRPESRLVVLTDRAQRGCWRRDPTRELAAAACKPDLRRQDL